jgi:filamentous hemagglutinin family protein
MTQNWHSRCWKFGLVSAFFFCGAFAFAENRTLAQTIVPDATLGTERSIVTPGVNVGGVSAERIDGGAVRGVNLFHSFREFNVGNGGAAYFANPTGIENILGRVTGTNPSAIFGKLGVLGTANLFVINPNGILFGPNAQLDIRGSFFASTASGFNFSDGSSFSATYPTAPPLLTINVTPGLQWGTYQQGATITNRGKLAAGQDLTLVADNLDLQGQLQAGGDLTLLAQDTVKVRDSVTTPFSVHSGGNLTVIGKGGIDILALNHQTQMPFVSGGNLSLISDGVISLDAHFRSGGSFSIKSVSGGLANLVSYYDPIISSTGDVDVAANYTGTSLLVEAQGNIRFWGDINITGPDTSTLPDGPDTATLSSSSALIMRSGQSSLAYGGVNSGAVPAYGTGGMAAGITIGGNVIVQPFSGVGGIVDLKAASGDVNTQLISTNGQQTFNFANDANGGATKIFAANGSISTGDLLSYSYSNSGNATNGGAVSLVAANGINITGDLLSHSFSSGGSGGNGGAISLAAANRINITGNLYSYSFSYSGSGGNGGAISLAAANGINITGVLSSLSDSRLGSGGNGGAISLVAANGSIHTDMLASESSSFSGSGGNGGAISLVAANGSIHTDSLGSSSFSGSGNAGNGGVISLVAANGNIHTDSLGSSSFSGSGSTGNGGAISLVATNGSIHTGYLGSSSSSFSGSAGNGGAISLVATNGSITTNSLSSYSSSFSGSAAQGGNISLVATNTIQLLRDEFDFQSLADKTFPGGSINSTGMLGSGNISIVSNAPLALDNSVISSDTFGSGKGGEIHISAPSISFTNGAQISASTHSSGRGGNITLIASDSVELSGVVNEVPKGIFFSDQTGFAGIPAGTFLGGFIPTGEVPPKDDNGVPQFPPGTLFPSGVFTQTTVGSTGSAGTISIETGRLIIKDQAAISTTTWGQGKAGNISVQSLDTISVANGSILSGVAGEARGDSGNIELQTRSLSITGGGFVQTQTLGEGKAGDIQVSATDLVSLSGNGSGLRSGSGGSNTLLGTTGSNIGQGGNISVTTDSLSLDDKAVLDAQTQTNSRGGDITVNANTLSAVNGGRLLTSTSGGGQAGDITLSAHQIQLSGSNSGLFAQTSSAAEAGNLILQPRGEGQTLRVNFWDGAQISASTSGSGRGGNLTITAPESLSLSGNGSIISAETSGSGTGGDLTLKTATLTVQDEAKVTVSSTETGDAGNLNVTANSVLLDNGELIAQTASGEGGNIYLKVDDLLSMRNNSLISAQAGNNGNGGNIDIDAQLIVAVPSENSDIVADADRGNGGNINITTQGIFGLEYRQERTPESDITASSRFGIAGTVNINQLTTDPSQGLTNLPTEVVDASNQMAQNCRAGGAAASEQSFFVVTGRGGLPPNPKEALSSEDVVVNWVPLNPREENPSSPAVSTKATNAAQTPIVEAQGWVMNDLGQVVLTASTPTVTPHSPWQKPTSCDAPQSASRS